jgi:hypothetical protein
MNYAACEFPGCSATASYALVDQRTHCIATDHVADLAACVRHSAMLLQMHDPVGRHALVVARHPRQIW